MKSYMRGCAHGLCTFIAERHVSSEVGKMKLTFYIRCSLYVNVKDLN